MSRPLVTFFVINSVTTFVISYLYNYYNILFNKKQQKDQNLNKDGDLEFIINKIKNLEQSIFLLQQNIDDIKITFEEKNNKVIESSTILNNKLEEFIHINYEVFD
jgi:hypothetical protein|uniref:Uncharacterized protein n=1 Tax=viral metagenome TaxID=1070528 RepID=A0A6C0AMB5_9ZZZZ